MVRLFWNVLGGGALLYLMSTIWIDAYCPFLPFFLWLFYSFQILWWLIFGCLPNAGDHRYFAVFAVGLSNARRALLLFLAIPRVHCRD